jgi:hypothetical protein
MSHPRRRDLEEHHSRTVLAKADAAMILADSQLDRLEALLVEVRRTERFVEDRRRRNTGRRPDRRRR